MTNKEKNIKSRIELLINNIDELDSNFVTYKAELIKTLLQSTLQFIKRKEQECETLKDEIKLAKEMLIQNDYKTNKNTLPQIIEEFISYNLLDMQNNEGYTIPVFIQVENKLEILEDLEQSLDEIEEFCTVYSANHDAYETVYKYILAFINKAKKGN